MAATATTSGSTARPRRRSSTASRMRASRGAIYYDGSQLVSLTGLLHSPVLRPYWKTHFREMGQFYADAANGDLPAYSFIEPRMVFNHNDMHPPWGKKVREDDVDVDGEKMPVYNSALSDVRAGDRLVQDIYDAVRTSRSSGGLQRHEHRAGDHLRRARRHVRPRSAADRHAAGPQRSGRDGLHLRPTGRARSHHRGRAPTPRGHRDPRRDAPRLGDQHPLPAARSRSADPPRPERQPDLQLDQPHGSAAALHLADSRRHSMQGATRRRTMRPPPRPSTSTARSRHPRRD